jgi:hypothetical protein
MARLKLLKSNGLKLLSWGHEATTYLCVGSLGFQGLSKSQQDNNICKILDQQPFIQEVLMKKNTYKLMMKHNPHPSCKPSNDKKHHLPKTSPPRSYASLQKR